MSTLPVPDNDNVNILTLRIDLSKLREKIRITHQDIRVRIEIIKNPKEYVCEKR